MGSAGEVVGVDVGGQQGVTGSAGGGLGELGDRTGSTKWGLEVLGRHWEIWEGWWGGHWGPPGGYWECWGAELGALGRLLGLLGVTGGAGRVTGSSRSPRTELLLGRSAGGNQDHWDVTWSSWEALVVTGNAMGSHRMHWESTEVYWEGTGCYWGC